MGCGASSPVDSPTEVAAAQRLAQQEAALAYAAQLLKDDNEDDKLLGELALKPSVMSSLSLSTNEIEAVHKRAEGGDLLAQLTLSEEMQPTSPSEALGWLTKAAEGGLVAAQLRLG